MENSSVVIEVRGRKEHKLFYCDRESQSRFRKIFGEQTDQRGYDYLLTALLRVNEEKRAK